jgi:hypothetical protein
MSILKYTTPAALGSELLGTELNGLGAGVESALNTTALDNTTNLNQFCSLELTLGSFDPGANKTVTLRVYANDGTVTPDGSGGATPTDTYVVAVSAGSSIKKVVFPQVKLYPFSMRFTIQNGCSNAFAASGHSMKPRTYNEQTTST